jgi:DNA-binding NarL/FixJ family response regulator
MTQKCCFAGIDGESIPFLTTVLAGAGLPTDAKVSTMNVAELSKIAPTLLVCDVDTLAVDKLEQLRQVRFVIPESTIAVYTGQLEETWATACHLAGASCVLSKVSSQSELSSGLRVGIRSGCFTDPRFGSAPRIRRSNGTN